MTRPEHQADGLCQLLSEQGFEPVRFPVIAIEPVADSGPARQQLQYMSQAHWVFFISANAVQYAHQLLNAQWPVTQAKIAAIGKKTAQVLEKLGLIIDLIPEKRFTTENLIRKLNGAALSNKRCLIIKGVGGRDALANLLEEQGAQVTCVDVYQRTLPQYSTDDILPLLQSQNMGYITITSQLALDNLLTLVGPSYQAGIKQTPMVVISERIARYAKDCGCKTVLLAAQASDEGLVETLVSTTNNEMGTAL